VVVGGGVVAAAAAYQLARQGAAVTIVEGDQRGIATNAGAGNPYLAAFPGGRVVAGATREEAGFQYSATVAGVGGLLAGAIDLAPGLGAAELLETRIGFRPATGDGWPVLGALADGLFVAAGHGAEGLTAGPVSGLAVAQLALGQEPAAGLAPFSPYRFQS
jgi:D-amino-acid dehydrogenase